MGHFLYLFGFTRSSFWHAELHCSCGIFSCSMWTLHPERKKVESNLSTAFAQLFITGMLMSPGVSSFTTPWPPLSHTLSFLPPASRGPAHACPSVFFFLGTKASQWLSWGLLPGVSKRNCWLLGPSPCQGEKGGGPQDSLLGESQPPQAITTLQKGWAN